MLLLEGEEIPFVVTDGLNPGEYPVPPKDDIGGGVEAWTAMSETLEVET